MTSIFNLYIFGILAINFVTCLPTIDNASYNVINSKLRKSSVCNTQTCKKAASIFLSHMDKNVNPCDNFYRFACGQFLKDTEVPLGQATADVTFSAEYYKLNDQLKDITENGIQKNEPNCFKKMKLFYDICMNTEQIEKNKEYFELMNKLGGWPVLLKDSWNESSFDWLDTLYKFKEANLPYDFVFYTEYTVDKKNNSIRRIYLDQPAFGIQESYLAEGLTNTQVLGYLKSMVAVVQVFGADPFEATQELTKSLNMEIELARISLTSNKRRDVNEMYNAMTFKELETNYSGIPYLTYLNKMLSPIHIDSSDIVIVVNPEYFSKLGELLSKVDKRAQANYLFWRQTIETAAVLGESISNTVSGLTTIYKNTNPSPRSKKCLDITHKMFKLLMAALYIRRYFDKETKQSAVKMTDNIRASFKKMLSEITWMDEKTKQQALAKLANIKAYLAYPDELLDDRKLDELYAPLKLYPESFLKSYISYRNFSLAIQFERLSRPINKTDWLDHSIVTAINAYYKHTENSILIPAAILQGVFFNKDHPKYMNYAGIGSILGHEMTHGFDDHGSSFDKDGNLVDWWDPETKKRYLERAQCIIDQYSNYTLEEIGIHLDGYKTQGENIADNGGLKEAYYAYEAFEKENGIEPHLPGLESYSSRQMFWLSNANMWCKKYRAEYLKYMVTNDPHPIQEFRIIGPMSNLPEFSKDFNCPLGSPMNPEKKCTVW